MQVTAGDAGAGVGAGVGMEGGPGVGVDGAAGVAVAGGAGRVFVLVVAGAEALVATGLGVVGFFLAGLRVK